MPKIVWSPHDLPHLVAKSVVDHFQLARTWETDPSLTSQPNHTDTAASLRALAGALHIAPLTWLDTGVCEVIGDSYDRVPEWSPVACMPGTSGIIAFESPFVQLPFASHNTDTTVWPYIDAVGWWESDPIVKISALSTFRGLDDALSPLRQPCPLHEVISTIIPLDAVAGAGVETEARLPDKLDIGGKAAHTAGETLLSVTGAAWLLMSQPRIVSDTDPAIARVKNPSRAPGSPKKQPVRVSVRTLESAPSGSSPGGQRGRATSRWWVRGHWRQQPYGKERALRKPVFIAPHTAGASDAPLDDRPQVQVWRDNRPDK